jgi:hypothetical protein
MDPRRLHPRQQLWARDTAVRGSPPISYVVAVSLFSIVDICAPRRCTAALHRTHTRCFLQRTIYRLWIASRGALFARRDTLTLALTCVCVFTPHTRYDERDLVNCMTKIDTVDFHQTMDVGGIKFTPYHAGHVLGAAMFMIEIAGIKVRNTRILWWIATV